MTLRLLLLVLLAQSVQPGQPAVQVTGTASISGRVVDGSTGKPISGALIRSFVQPVATAGQRVPGQPPETLLAGSDGSFRLDALPAGKVGLTAVRLGYVGGGYEQRSPRGFGGELALRDGEAKSGVVLRLWKQASIAGRVFDEAGEPLVNVSIRAYSRSSGGDRRYYAARTIATDDRGAYRLALLDPGEYIVGIVPRNVGMPLPVAQSVPGTSNYDLRGEIGAFATPGTPTALNVRDQLFMLGGGTPIPALRGDRLLTYPPWFYPSAPDLSQAARIVVGPAEERDGIDLYLHPSATVRISGTVTGLTAGVAVRLIPSYNAEINLDAELPAALTDGSGSFTFLAVPPGEYVLQTTTLARTMGQDRARSEDMQFAEMPLSVAESDVDGIALQLRPGLRVRGRIEFDGGGSRPSPLSSVQVIVEPVIGSPSRATVGDTGALASLPLLPGRYYVRVPFSPKGWMFKSATLNGRDVADIPIEVRSGDVNDVVVTFSDRWSGLSGSVAAASGAPATEGMVVVFPTDPLTWSSGGSNPRRVRITQVSDGRYNFSVLPPGDYYVAAIPGTQVAEWRDPRFLESAARSARRVTIGDGERPVQDLKAQEVR